VSRCVQIALKRWRRFVPLCKKEYAIQGWMEHSLDTKLTSTLYQWYKWMFEEINEKAKTARVVAHWERIEMRRSLRCLPLAPTLCCLLSTLSPLSSNPIAHSAETRVISRTSV